MKRTGSIVLGVGLLLLAAGLVRQQAWIWAGHAGVVTSDPYTYAAFARVLASGHVFLDEPADQLVKIFHGEASRGRDPFWNTVRLPDGRRMFSVAAGYPLVLAALLKAGGNWLMLHANLLLLLLCQLLLVRVVWVGWSQRGLGLVAGTLAALGWPLTAPLVFSQFAYPWREPLLYACLLGALLVLLHAARSPSAHGWLLLGLLCGYAVAVKESAVLYAAWLLPLAIFAHAEGLGRPQWRRVPGLLLGFAVGVAPLLLQNLAATDHWWLSAQTLRETSQYSLTQSGFGLSAGNAPDTLTVYALYYGRLPWFGWPFLLVALAGVWFARRRLISLVLLGWLTLHVALYLQWGNADLRHMYLAHIPYAYFLAAGVVGICGLILQWIKLPRGLGAVLLTCLPLVFFFTPQPWGRGCPELRRQMGFWRADWLCAEIAGKIPPDSLVLVNRPLRDMLGAYTDVQPVRLQELIYFCGQNNAGATLQPWLANGLKAYFLDNPDQDPSHVEGLLDWARQDREDLLASFDLKPATVFRTNENTMQACYNGQEWRLTDRDAVTLYQILPRTADTVRVKMQGASPVLSAFLCVNTALPASFLRMNQVAAGPAPVNPYFWPMPAMDYTNSAVFEWTGGTQKLPASISARWVDWAEQIRLDCGADAMPADRFIFSPALTNQPAERYRIVPLPTTLNLPMRAGFDFFTRITITLHDRPAGTNYWVRLADNLTVPARGTNNRLEFDWPASAMPTSNQARVESFQLESDLPAVLNVERIDSETIYTSLRHDHIGRDMPFVCFRGEAVRGYNLIGSPTGTATITWRGSPYDDDAQKQIRTNCPAFGLHTISIPMAGFRGLTIDCPGLGWKQPVWADVGASVTISPDGPTRVLLQSGFYPLEKNPDPFRWTYGCAKINLPAGLTNEYLLVLDARDGCPNATRELTIQIGPDVRKITLPAERKKIEVRFPGTKSANGAWTAILTVPEWSPAEITGSPDPRRLGFQFFGLDWAPVGMKEEP